MKDLITISEAMKITGWTRQNLYIKKKLGRIKMEKVGNRVFLTMDELNRHRETLYDRSHNYKPDELSVRAAADILGFNSQRIYYFLRLGYFTFKRRGGIIILDKKEIEDARGKYRKAIPKSRRPKKPQKVEAQVRSDQDEEGQYYFRFQD
jgi:hypothetical protein